MLKLCKTPTPLIGGDTCEVASNLHRILDYPDPIPANVVVRAAEDREYLHELIVHRKSRETLQRLFSEASEKPDSTDSNSGPNIVRVLFRFAGAIFRWLVSGGRRVDAETFERRIRACSGCPHLVSAPSGIMRRAVRILSSDQKICDLCGCSVSCKARLATEACPDAHPFDPSRTRWGDPLEGTEMKNPANL